MNIGSSSPTPGLVERLQQEEAAYKLGGRLNAKDIITCAAFGPVHVWTAKAKRRLKQQHPSPGQICAGCSSHPALDAPPNDATGPIGI